MAVVVSRHAENRAIVCGLLGEAPRIRQADRVTSDEVPDEQLLVAHR